MAFSFVPSWVDYTSDAGSRSVPLGSRGGDVFFVIHHAVNYRVQDTIALSKPGGKQVSMTFAIGPTVSGAEAPVYCVYTVDESLRPYTTASFIDNQAITVEVSNLDMSATYPVAMGAKEWCAKIAAWMHVQYGMPLDRWHVTSHQEVFARGWGSYATACPGPDLQAALDWIVARARELVSGAEVSPEQKERDDMQIITNAAGGQMFVDEFGADPIGRYFFTPNGAYESPSWEDNIYASWVLAGKPETARDDWQYELVRHIADARWGQKRGQIVGDVVKSLTPFLEQLASAVSGLDPESVKQTLRDGLENVVLESAPLSEEDAAKIAELTREQFRQNPLT